MQKFALLLSLPLPAIWVVIGVVALATVMMMSTPRIRV